MRVIVVRFGLPAEHRHAIDSGEIAVKRAMGTVGFGKAADSRGLAGTDFHEGNTAVGENSIEVRQDRMDRIHPVGSAVAA
jgi:hypothetical protein